MTSISLTENKTEGPLLAPPENDNGALLYQYWSEDDRENFATVSNRILCPPVIQLFFYDGYGEAAGRRKAALKKLIGEVDRDWKIRRLVPAHFDILSDCTNSDFIRAFDFLENEKVSNFFEPDLRSLRLLQGLLR